MPLPTDEQELAYLAGYFDGEGSICFLNKKDRHYNSLCVAVSSSDVKILERFAIRFGGSVKPLMGKSVNRLMYRWRRDGIHAQAVIAQLLPYLWGKKYPAIFASFLKLDYPKGMRIPPWQARLREEVYEKVRAFNHRVTNPNRLSPS